MKRETSRNAPAEASQRPIGDVHSVPSCRRIVRSEELLEGDDSVTIDHNGKLYLLCSLPSGRLILTGWDAGKPGPIRSRPSFR